MKSVKRPRKPEAIDPEKVRRCHDFTQLALERVDQVIHDVAQLLDEEETLSVALNIICAIAVKTAQFAETHATVTDRGVRVDGNRFLEAIGAHVSHLRLPEKDQ